MTDLPIEQEWNIASVYSPAVQGHIVPTILVDVTAGNVWYYPSVWPAQIPINDVVYAGVTCWNDSIVAVKLYLSIQFVNPSGNGVGLSSQTITLPAGGAQAIATGNVTFKQLGSWQLLARMVQA